MRWFLLSAGLLGALAQPGLAQDTGCKTSLGIPCHTIRGTGTQWQANSWTLSQIRRVLSTDLHAVRRDGSSVNQGEVRFQDIYGRGKGEQEGSGLYLAPENAIVTVNSIAHTIARREPLIWHDLPYRRSRSGDTACASGILHSGTDFVQNGTAIVAGVPVVKWYRTLGNGGFEEQALAPSLDCMALSKYQVRRNAFWLPEFINSWEATSVEFGEPASGLFRLPDGYREIEDPRRAQMIRYIDQHGGRIASPPRK
ncbi:MAG: hypothetical protein ABI823_15090 [Bryobacteraceae bacterium]